MNIMAAYWYIFAFDIGISIGLLIAWMAIVIVEDCEKKEKKKWKKIICIWKVR